MNQDLRKALAEERCVSVPDLAAALGISANSLYRAVSRNEVDGVRIGGRVVIPAHIARGLLRLPDPAPIAA